MHRNPDPVEAVAVCSTLACKSAVGTDESTWLTIFSDRGAAALGGGYYYYSSSSKPAEVAQQAASAVAGASSGKKAFTGGDQGFISLKLAEIENLSHNTKRVRFALPEDDQESGLPVACESLPRVSEPHIPD